MNKEFDFAKQKEAYEAITSTTSSIKELRANAFKTLTETGMPTTRDEAWRFTNVKPLLDLDINYKSQKVESTFNGAIDDKYKLSEHIAVFVDGVFSEELSSLGEVKGQLTISSIDDCQKIGEISSLANRPFVALNTALFSLGNYIVVEQEIEDAVQFLYLTTKDSENSYRGVRNYIHLKSGAKLNLIETYYGENDVTYFNNIVTEVQIENGAKLDQFVQQSEGDQGHQFSAIFATLGEDSHYNTTAVSLGIQITRHDVNVSFDAENSTSQVNGIYIGKEKQLLDQQVKINHNAPHCESSQLFRGILADNSRGIFNGLIRVEKEGQKTDATQSNKTLLFSRDARIHTLPKLEIYADDVKCAHGATVGELDKDQLFYLLARGIPEDQARKLLTFAFITEVMETIALGSVKEKVTELIHTDLTKKF